MIVLSAIITKNRSSAQKKWIEIVSNPKITKIIQLDNNFDVAIHFVTSDTHTSVVSFKDNDSVIIYLLNHGKSVRYSIVKENGMYIVDDTEYQDGNLVFEYLGNLF